MILDSTIPIAAERKRFDMHRFIQTEAAMDMIYITSITASELLHGVHRATPENRGRREAYVEGILRSTTILPFDLASARRHAGLWAELEVRGARIGSHDMLIAAVCLRFNHRLATLNEGEFSRVPGLQLANARPYLIER